MLLEDRWSSRPRLGEERGQGEDRIDSGAAGGQVELLAQAGVGGRQGEDRIHGSAARGQLELHAGCGRGRERT